jgi:hypothetical protein
VGSSEQPSHVGLVTPSQFLPTVLNLGKAWPQVVVRTFDSSTWVEIAITPDGGAALGEALTRSVPHSPIGPAVMDRRTGNVTVIRDFTNRVSQVVSIAGDGNWVAWVEGSIQPSFADWVLYSYDRLSHQIRTLAEAPKSHPNTPSLQISMSNGVIVWSAVEAPDGLFHVYSVNADGSGSLKVLAANAKGPQIVWPWVAYDLRPAGPGTSATLARQNLETGEVRQITGPADVSYFAFDGEALAWISAAMNDIFLQPKLDSAPIHLHSGRYLQFVSLNRRLVGWGQDQGALVYDRKIGAIVQLSNLYDSYPVISDQALDWLYQPNPNATKPFEGTVWREVDLADLP